MVSSNVGHTGTGGNQVSNLLEPGCQNGGQNIHKSLHYHSKFSILRIIGFFQRRSLRVGAGESQKPRCDVKLHKAERLDACIYR